MRQWIAIVLGMSSVGIFACGLAVGMLVLPGCGGGGAKEDVTSQEDDAPKQSGNGTSVASNGVRVDEDGRKWLENDFPYDVWYNNPIDVAQQQGTVASAATDDAGTSPTDGDDPPTESASAAGSGGDINWKDVVAGSIIDSEVKKISNRFRAKLQTRASYNSSFLELPPHVATMAVLSGIAAQHPEDIRWKENAKQIRDLTKKMLSEKLKSGAKSYNQMNEPYLSIADILSGSPPGGLPEPNEDDNFSEYAEMSLLMKRFDVGGKWLQINVGTEDALKENADAIKQEVGVLAALATAMTTEGYGFVDDDEFKGFAAGFVEHCNRISEAASTGNFENFQLSASQFNQACDKCHSSYR